MLYRILVSTSKEEQELDFCSSRGICGAGSAMLGFYDLKVPRFKRRQDKKCKFFFTEKGWQEIGRRIAADAQREGRVVRVIKIKNVDRGQIVYQDEFQVAILMGKGKRK